MTVDFDAQAIIDRVHQAANATVRQAAENILSRAIEKIQNPPKTGQVYRRRGIEHQASAPGEAPASDTGRLIQSGRTEFDTALFTGRIIFSTAYAARLEYGDEEGIIESRPYARVSLNEETENFIRDLRQNIRDAL